MKFDMDFNFPYSHVVVRGLDEEAVAEYSESMKYEVPFEVTQPAMPDVWQPPTETTYLINPNMVTYVEIIEKKEH